VAIGRDSGVIGSAGFDSTAADLDAQIREMRETAQQITIGTADISELSERLSRTPVPTARPAFETEREEAKSLAAFAAAKAAEEGRRLAGEATDFGRRQAGEVVDRAGRLVQEKGLGAAREIGDFTRSEVGRIGREARELADRKARSATARAADAARGKLDQSRRTTRRVVKRAGRQQAAARCAVCKNAVTPGDRPVVCPDCGARYHAECYELAGACVSEECLRKRRSSTTRAAPTVAPLPAGQPVQRTERGRRCLACGARVSDKALVCPHCGRWLHGKSGPTGRFATGPSGQSQIGPGCVVAVIIAALFFFIVISRL